MHLSVFVSSFIAVQILAVVDKCVINSLHDRLYLFFPFHYLLSELFDLEVNERVQKIVNVRQMPTIEYIDIKIHDYSKSLSLCLYLYFTGTILSPCLN